jgi:dTDP-4-dehydrorhamnose reductase
MVRKCLDRSISVTGTFHSNKPSFEIPLENLDLRDATAFESLLQLWDPDAVVNCAALTDVDGCESQDELAFEVNGAAPGDLAAACAKEGIEFVHVSTDYVFDGTETAPYDESATPNPIQEYGKSKLEGEIRVREADGQNIVTRLSFVYGVRGDTDELVGFPAWARDSLRAGDELPLFVDQHVSPSRAGQTARTILELLDIGVEGVFNVATRSCVTPYEFGKEMARLRGADTSLLRESERSNIDRDADRPTNTCLDVTKVEKTLGRPQPTVEEDLKAIEDWIRI